MMLLIVRSGGMIVRVGAMRADIAAHAARGARPAWNELGNRFLAHKLRDDEKLQWL
jgi:hypothetical protein